MSPAASLPAERERILILDFGSQVTQLIARRIEIASDARVAASPTRGDA